MKKLALSLIFALTISLAACGAEAPPTVSGEPLPEASAAATSWDVRMLVPGIYRLSVLRPSTQARPAPYQRT